MQNATMALHAREAVYAIATHSIETAFRFAKSWARQRSCGFRLPASLSSTPDKLPAASADRSILELGTENKALTEIACLGEIHKNPYLYP